MTANPSGRRAARGEASEEPVQRAVRAARAHANAAAEIVTFLQRLGPLPDPAADAEYAFLRSREESALDERTEALRAAGLSVPSLDDDG